MSLARDLQRMARAAQQAKAAHDAAQHAQAERMRDHVRESGVIGGTMSFDDDDAPEATRGQKIHVGRRVGLAVKHGVLAVAPDLDGITIAQAEAILTALGDDPAALWTFGMADKAGKKWKKERQT